MYIYIYIKACPVGTYGNTNNKFCDINCGLNNYGYFTSCITSKIIKNLDCPLGYYRNNFTRNC
jgi:hypothetical protein